MYHNELVIRTKLTPPRPRRHNLHRQRLTARLSEALDYRLTLVHAGTGYGKSTALASLSGRDTPLCWYSIADEDTDPFVFLLHLIYACRLTLPATSDAPLAMLEKQGESPTPAVAKTGEASPAVWYPVVDALVNALTEALDGPTLLIFDDYHLVGEAPQISAIVDRLAGYAPADLHIILSGRHPPNLPGLVVDQRNRGVGHCPPAYLARTPERCCVGSGHPICPPALAN
jgi:ATP/maltotriose-dependent transcriptional regulator MalT